MRLPVIALDREGLVTTVNAAANVVFDNNIKDRRLFVRDPDARRLLKEATDQLNTWPPSNSLALEPVIVPRTDKLPVIMRIWPFEGLAQPPGPEVRALLTLNAFDVSKNPWIDVNGASAKAVAEQVKRCPSGALTYELLKNAE
jgi:hypothetical protein